MSFASITLCVASQRVILKVSVYFVIDSVRKLLDTPLYYHANRMRRAALILRLDCRKWVVNFISLPGCVLVMLPFVSRTRTHRCKH